MAQEAAQNVAAEGSGPELMAAIRVYGSILFTTIAWGTQ